MLRVQRLWYYGAMADLVTVNVETKLGVHYVFPDMPRAEMEQLFSSSLSPAVVTGQLTLVNLSKACLVMPFRIVKTISINGEQRWPSLA